MKNWCCCSNMSPKQIFTCLVSLFFGGWLFYVGAVKWCPSIVGPLDFVGWIQSDFAKTWIPGFLVTLTAWIILIAEPLLGAMLIISRGKCRLTWVLTAGLMFMLLLGKTVQQDHATVANIWQFLILCVVGACFADKACMLAKGSCSSTSPEKSAGSCCSGNKSDSCCS